MLEILRINDFAQKGVNTDLPDYELPGGYVTDMNNIRVINNKLQSFGGYRIWTTPPVEFEPGWLINAGSLTGNAWLIAGETAVYSWDGVNWNDISSAIGYGDISNKSLWTGDVFTHFIVATHPQIYPEYWTGDQPTDQMLPLQFDNTQTFADVDIRVGVMRAHKQFLIALSLVESGIEFIDEVRWSNAADVGELPSSWDEKDPDNLAGKAALGGPGGKIIDGRPLRDSFAVYRENGITMMDSTNDFFVWRFRHLQTTSGLINKNCVVQVKGLHYYISDGDIVVNDGNLVKSIMHKKLRKRFIASINVENFDNSYAMKDDFAKEIWFCVPEGDDLFPGTAYIFNWTDKTWFIRDLNPEAIFTAYGPELASEKRTWDTWFETWNTATGSWGQSSKTPLVNTLVSIVKNASSQLSQLIILDAENKDNTEVYISFVERTGMPIEGFENVTTIRSIYPHMSGTGTIRIRIGSQRHANAPIQWKPYVNFDPSTDRKIDIRTTGELHCFRFEGDSNLNEWSVSGMDIEYVNAGSR